MEDGLITNRINTGQPVSGHHNPLSLPIPITSTLIQKVYQHNVNVEKLMVSKLSVDLLQEYCQ